MKKSTRTIIKGAIVVLSLIFVISAIALAINVWDENNGKYETSESGSDTVLEHDGKKYDRRSDIETFLIIGLDKFSEDINNTSYENDQMADFVTLLVVDNQNKKWEAIQFNRDTIVDCNDLGVAGHVISTEKKQLALAHTQGNGKEVSCRNVADSVSKLLYGVNISNYISLTMSAVEKYNDMVGGVEVEILDDFTGVNDELVKGTVMTLNGKQALSYVRERKGMEDSSNESRMKRQRQYLKALYEKSLKSSKENENFIKESAASIAEDAVSNLSSGKLENLLKKLSEYEFVELHHLEGESKVGEKYMEFYPDEDSLKELVISLFYKEVSDGE